MSERFDLIIRNARDVTGRNVDIGIRDQNILSITRHIAERGLEYDARQLTIGPGFHDHHIHLLATAARMESVDLTDCMTAPQIIACLRESVAQPGKWVRAIGYDERAAGLPDRKILDKWLPHSPLRIQDRTGGYWFLNSAAIALMGSPPFPDCVERDADGNPSGRIWRGDHWLRDRIPTSPPSLTALSKKMARYGITAVTDAGASNGAAEAALIAGAIPQRLTMMGTEHLPAGQNYLLGPVKLLFDENDLPPLNNAAARIAEARSLGRNVAAHCVTLGELIFYLAALDMAGGAKPGDRIEHGAIIPQSFIGDIAAAGLTVVTQANFIHDRGDRYLAQMESDDLPNLYRLGSLLSAGISVRGGSDAPYGDVNPWVALRAATNRRTKNGDIIGECELISRTAALSCYQAQTLAVGMPADLILYDWPKDPDAVGQVSLTLIGGEIIWQV